MSLPASNLEILKDGPHTDARRLDIAVVFSGVLILAVFWYFCVWFIRPQILSDLAGDIPRLWLPSVIYSVGSVQSGEIPLWNPYEFLGMPMFATLEYGPLYPPNWIFFVLPVETGHLVGAFFHQALLAVGVLVFLRRAVAVSRTAALFGAVCVAMSGWSTFRMLTEFDAYRSAAYIPWILFAAYRLNREPCAGRCAFAAGLIALQLLAGEAEIWVRSTILFGLYSAFCLWQRGREGAPGPALIQSTILLGSAVVLALGLLAIQLLPTFEASQLSLRSIRGMTFEQAFRGGVSDAGYLLASICVHEQAAHDFFVGFIPLLIAGYGLVRGNSSTYFFAGIALIAFDLMLGENGYTAYLYYSLPTGNWFRAPIRFLPFFVIAFSVVAAKGVDSLLRDFLSPRNGKLRTLAFAWLVMGCIPVVVSETASSRMEFLLALVVLLGISVAALLSVRSVTPAYAHGAALVALIGAQLAPPFTLYDLREFNIPEKLDFVGPAADAMDILEDRTNPAERVYVDYAWETGRRAPKFGTVTRIPCIDGLSPFMPRSYWDFIYPYSSTRIRDVHERSGGAGMSIKSGVWGGLALESDAATAFDMLGVRYIVSGLGSELTYSETGEIPVPDQFAVVYRQGGMTVFENRSAWPRAFVLKASNVPTIESLIASYRDGITPARLDAYGAQYVRLTVTSNGGLLVLTDQVYPGWEAYVDGRRTEVLAVGGVFRGVKLPGGEHSVDFRYRPRTFAWGAIISGISLVTLVLIVLVAWTIRRTHHEDQKRGAPRSSGDAPPKSA